MKSTVIVNFLLLFIIFISLGRLTYGKEAKTAGLKNLLAIDLTTDKSVYRAGEPVGITIAATNKSRAAVDLLFGSGQSYDIKITGINNKDVWHWSHNKVFTMAIRHVKLLPRQNLKYDFTWQQLDNNGRPVKKGKYFIRGCLTTATQLLSQKKVLIIK